jgi:hypothetical protein
VEVLKQPQYDPQPVEREVVQVFAVTGGYLDAFPVEDAKRFATEFCVYLEARHPNVFSEIRETGELTDAHEEILKSALESFGQSFRPTVSGPGSEAGLGQGTPPDEVKPDVGWDRMSSVDEAEVEAAGEHVDAEGGDGT